MSLVEPCLTPLLLHPVQAPVIPLPQESSHVKGGMPCCSSAANTPASPAPHSGRAKALSFLPAAALYLTVRTSSIDPPVGRTRWVCPPPEPCHGSPRAGNALPPSPTCLIPSLLSSRCPGGTSERTFAGHLSYNHKRLLHQLPLATPPFPFLTLVTFTYVTRLLLVFIICSVHRKGQVLNTAICFGITQPLICLLDEQMGRVGGSGEREGPAVQGR